ncbi:MAG: CocE/NonD family hydrolase [Chloroflexi bacterium]|nr:CocE/NonD family hydrolase [Chloroflexota bacterium]
MATKSKAYEGSQQEYGVVWERNVMMPVRDGVKLATDIYYPATDGKRAGGKFPVVLERTPYDKQSAVNVTKGKYFARRGYVCVIQDVRGRFRSEGEWYPFAHEAPDGFDCVEWLGTRSWSNGKVGTMGDSYCGSDQAALATMNPPHLSTMIVAVGAANYFHSSMRQNGALEQRFLIYAIRMAVTSKEAEADPVLKAELEKAWTQNIRQIVDKFPLRAGTTVLRRVPSYEKWAIDILTHGEYDDYWKQRGYAPDEYYEEHADVPSLYLGGWYDTYPRNTTESFVELSRMKKSPQRLLMGPWTHGQYEITNSGDADFGVDSHIHYHDLKLAWFDHYMKGLHTEFADWEPVRIFTMGTGSGRRNYDGRVEFGGWWRSEKEWPLSGTKYTPYYLNTGGVLTTKKPAKSAAPSTFTFDPKNPVPTIGGSMSAVEPIMVAGAFDQRGRADFHGCKDTMPLNTRKDVLTFQTDVLPQDVEATGPIEVRLWIASSAVDTDFTAKLIDVHPPTDDYPDGLAMNITDSIMRARYRNSWEKPELMEPGKTYELKFELFPTSMVFRKGHRIRADISSSNWPRFDVNPNTGEPLGVPQAMLVAQQTVFHDAERPSRVVLPIIPERSAGTGQNGPGTI